MSIIEFPVKVDLTGKTVAVSPENPHARYQCRGFVVFRNSPQVVGPEADFNALQTALLDGRLIELSPGSVIKSSNASLNPAGELGETDKKLFTLLTKEGYVVLTPDTPEQSAAIEKELQDTGQLDLSHFPTLQKAKAVVPHLSAITITDLDDQPNAEQSSSN